MLNRLNLDEVSPKDALDILYAIEKTSRKTKLNGENNTSKKLTSTKKIFLVERDKNKKKFFC